MKLTAEERLRRERQQEEHALHAEFYDWRQDHGFEPTSAQVGLFTHLQQLAIEACPAQNFTEWDAEHAGWLERP